ncbi:MAG: CDF family Co(II)/Ni(II) efflux transporter DmeF [Gammaproteobacteria bacterium]
MHSHTLERWRHSHDFNLDSAAAERSTLRVIALTAVTMVVEIVGGLVLGSMALLADGWHMATHIAAFAITLFAYRYARQHADNPRYSFGTGKVSSLGAFASAVALGVVALVMALESGLRLFSPHAIAYGEAMSVAVLGLVVNLACGAILARAGAHHDHHHAHGPHHAHGGGDARGVADVPAAPARDRNLHAAYVHVLADALTSVLAILALAGGMLFGWAALDPLMGLVGAAIIARWSWSLVGDSSEVLLDATVDARTQRALVDAIEADADNRVADVHVWQVGIEQYAAEIVLVTHRPRPPEHYKRLLDGFPGLAHVVVEVNPCHDRVCTP